MEDEPGIDLSVPPVLTCEGCGKTDETVRERSCGYELDVNDADPEDCIEVVCDDCEDEHCDEI